MVLDLGEDLGEASSRGSGHALRDGVHQKKQRASASLEQADASRKAQVGAPLDEARRARTTERGLRDEGLAWPPCPAAAQERPQEAEWKRTGCCRSGADAAWGPEDAAQQRRPEVAARLPPLARRGSRAAADVGRGEARPLISRPFLWAAGSAVRPRPEPPASPRGPCARPRQQRRRNDPSAAARPAARSSTKPT